MVSGDWLIAAQGDLVNLQYVAHPEVPDKGDDNVGTNENPAGGDGPFALAHPPEHGGAGDEHEEFVADETAVEVSAEIDFGEGVEFVEEADFVGEEGVEEVDAAEDGGGGEEECDVGFAWGDVETGEKFGRGGGAEGARHHPPAQQFHNTHPELRLTYSNRRLDDRT
jgi:hypothetical protein